MNCPRTRLAVEPLEDRAVPATLSISDATATEGSAALKILDRFVAAGSGGLSNAKGSVFGPDGNGDGTQDLYVASASSDAILRYDGGTGAFIDTFVPSGSGGLDNPVCLAFDSADRLYVSTGASVSAKGKVFRYDADGSNPVVVVSDLMETLGLAFGTDGSLFIADKATDQVLRYDGSGLSVFISAGSGGLVEPFGVVFGPDGNLYVASHGTGQVLRYHATTGAFLGTFATTNLGGGPFWLRFGTDGYLYTTVRTSGAAVETSFVRFDASTGAFVDRLDLGRDGWAFTLGSDNLVYDSGFGGSFVDRIGSSSIAAFTVSLSTASATEVTIDYTTVSGSGTSGSDFTPVSGTLSFAPGQTSRSILVPTIDDATAEGPETFSVTLSNPVGATITDGTGIVSITDDDATKFFVVNEGSPDRTYRYNALGTAQANTALGSGNTAPRGAASTAAGDTVWVVDANKKVYVYSAAGTLLGSWTAGSLASNAQVEGITTNGTDIWIVDNKQNKVFKYAGAASRLSGSQNATSSFNLNGSNTSPKDLVTDGTSIWVVNDTWSSDKVFKYTLSGSHQGNWTLSGGGGSPTGITLDPSAPDHLWVVDNASDRVYQYDNAVGRTSGSQSASTSFALTAGNTNPQGIADPPVNGGVPLDSTARHGRKANHAARRDVAVAPTAGNWLPPEAYDWAPIDVSTPRGKAKRA